MAIQNITALPTPPSRLDPSNFSDRADTFLGALPVFVTELNTAGDNIETTQASVDAAKVAAQTAQGLAESARDSAVITAGAGAWVSGQAYLQYANAIDTVDFKTYRAKANITSVTRPGLDSTNWQLLTNLGDVTLSGTQTITGAKTFSSVISGSTSTQVSLTGNQTVAGIKTFSSSPVVPAGATGAQVPQAQEIPLLIGITSQIGYFATATAPTGWLKANGAAISRTVYADLYAKIGTIYGAGDGSSTFNLPDMRGVFPRGWDDSRGLDSGRAFGSYQADEFGSHSHNLSTTWGSQGCATGTARYPAVYNIAGFQPTTVAVGGSETRPKNVALLACIKY